MLVRLGYGLRKFGSGGSNSTPAAPVNTVAPVISGAVTIGSTLTSTTGSWTGYPAPTFAYQWRRGGVNIGSATSSSYVTQAADEGLAIDCVVMATNSEGSASQDSNNITVGYASANSVAPAVTGTPEIGETLSCSTGTWTGTATITYAYQWRRDGVNIGSATANTYTLVAADDLTSVDCVVTATNSYGSAALDSNNVSVTYPAPVNSVAPVVSGTAKVGETLSSTTGTWSNSPTSYTYQWRRDAADIVGATSSTYVLAAADDLTDVDCNVTATNSGGSASADSNDVAVTYNVPVNSVAPVASGTGEVGQTLSVTTGTWSNSPTSYTYQWRRNGSNISLATSSTYLLVSADAGTNVDCVVTASNSGGAGVGVDSNDIAVAAASWPTYSEFTLTMPAGGEWVGLYEVRILDQNDNEWFAALTAVNGGSLNTLATISAGQFTTDSAYNGAGTTDEDRLKDNIPDVTNAASPVSPVYWSNGVSSGMKIFAKPSTAKSIKEIQIAVYTTSGGTSYDNWIPLFTVTADGGTLTPSVTPPASWANYFQTTNNADSRWFKWVFDENS